MEFDKSKILTVVTADQLKEGQLGWINDTVDYLKSDIQNIRPYKVFSTNENIVQDFPFTAEYRGTRRYFYPAPEQTYAERQAEWVKANNIKEGTKVRVTRTFTKDEDGSCCWGHDDLVGMTGSVYAYDIVSHILGVIMSDGKLRVIPYFALEVIKEPTYRPFNEDELNDLVGKIVRNKQTGYRKLVTGKPTTSLGVNLEGKYINAKDLLNSFMMDDGKSPCGIKEEV